MGGKGAYCVSQSKHVDVCILILHSCVAELSKLLKMPMTPFTTLSPIDVGKIDSIIKNCCCCYQDFYYQEKLVT